MANLPCPAVKELMLSLKGAIPFLSGTYKEVNGKMLPRLQWSAGGGLNRHDAGLALDIILFNHVPREKALAHHLMMALVDNIPAMKWQSAIYEKVVFSSSGIPKPFTDNEKHNTHIHIDWMIYELYLKTGKKSIPWSAEAYTKGFMSSLMQQFKEINTSWEQGKLSPLNLMASKKAGRESGTNK